MAHRGQKSTALPPARQSHRRRPGHLRQRWFPARSPYAFRFLEPEGRRGARLPQEPGAWGVWTGSCGRPALWAMVLLGAGSPRGLASHSGSDERRSGFQPPCGSRQSRPEVAPTRRGWASWTGPGCREGSHPTRTGVCYVSLSSNTSVSFAASRRWSPQVSSSSI